MVKVFSMLGGPWEAIKEYIGNIFGAIYSLIPKTIYLICTFIMQIIDLAQLVFKKLAGVDVYYVYQTQNAFSSDQAVSGDIIEYFVNEIIIGDGALHTAFIGILIIGACLLFLSTLLAVFRTQYMAEDAKSASPKKAIGNAIKAIVSFIVVPAACVLGVMISGQIIQAIESATNVSAGNITATGKQNLLKPYDMVGGGTSYIGYDLLGVSSAGSKTTPISGIVFRASAYRANRIRNSSQFRAACQGTGGDETVGSLNYSVNMNGLFDWQGDNYEDAAATLDDAFANCYKLKTATFANISLGANPYMAASFVASGVVGDFTVADIAIPVTVFSKYRVGVVWYYYDLWQFDFIIAVGSIVTILVIFINLILGLTKRIFEIAMLTLVSPGLIGITPLDGGAGLKRWREFYIKRVIGAYAAIFAMNVFYLLLPVFSNIGLFGIRIIDNIINVIFIIAGLVSIRDLIKLISDVIGAENYEEVGQKMSKDFVNKAMQIGSTISSFASPAAGLAKKFMKASPGGGLAEAVGGITNAFNQTPVGKAVNKIPSKIKGTYDNILKKSYLGQSLRHQRESQDQYTQRIDDLKEYMKTKGYSDTHINSEINNAEASGKLRRGQRTTAANLSAFEREIYEKKYPEYQAQRAKRIQSAFQQTGNFSRSVFTTMSDDQEWGFGKMKERNDKGVGLKAIFGKNSNFAGGTTKSRKLAASQEDLVKQQKNQAAVYKESMDELVRSNQNEYNKYAYDPADATKFETERHNLYKKVAQEFAAKQGRSLTPGDISTVVYYLSNGQDPWSP